MPCNTTEIKVLENLENLTNLKELQIGNNCISSIGHALNSNVALEVLLALNLHLKKVVTL